MTQTVQDPTYIRNQRDDAPGATDAVVGGQLAQSARQAPGQRVLSDREREQRQIALSATVPASKRQAMCECTKVIHFSVFFDGTGNNRFDEMAKPQEERALSNIAKLFDAHKRSDSQIANHYIPGVGTKYPEIGDNGGSLAQAIGRGADKRVKKAVELLDQEIAKVPAQQKIVLINVVVFGFSRGAAQTRAFLRDLAALCTEEGGGYRYKGLPLRVAFAGLFDTVCSAYDDTIAAAASTNGGHNGWAHDVKLAPMVEQSVHMIAAHEARRRFPLDSTRIDAAYPGNTIEIWYPGVHADVGGGYAPQYQGRENTLSRFSLNEMFDAAFAAGVLFEPIAALDPTVQDEFNKDSPELRTAFNAYLQAVAVKQGPMEEVQAAHMGLLHRWLKVRVRENAALASTKRLQVQKAQAGAEAKALNRQRWQLLHDAGVPDANDPALPAAQRDEHDAIVRRLLQAEARHSEAGDALDDLREEDAKCVSDVADMILRARQGAQLTLRERTIKQAWEDDSPLPDAVGAFFDLFAHDSVAHFDFDTSRLTDWRTIYFAGTKYKPS